MTDLTNLGEFGLIDSIRQRFGSALPAGFTGIGDDCAVVPRNEEMSWLITTDMLIENIHFLAGKMPAQDLGYKSLAVNLSDIAAMGGQPLFGFLSLALPNNLDSRWIREFLDGVEELCLSAGVRILGGDTNRSNQDIVISFTVIGEARNSDIKLRSTAKPGDLVCVTDNLGDSAAGFKVLSQNVKEPELESLVLAHFRPRPHLAEGQWLASFSGVHAMMDLSDGLASDLRHILKESACGASIAVEQIPMSESMRTFAERAGLSAIELALTGGEDYCLLCTIDPASFAEVSKRFHERFSRQLSCVGEIESGAGLRLTKNGNDYRLPGLGYDHFQ